MRRQVDGGIIMERAAADGTDVRWSEGQARKQQASAVERWKGGRVPSGAASRGGAAGVGRVDVERGAGSSGARGGSCREWRPMAGCRPPCRTLDFRERQGRWRHRGALSEARQTGGRPATRRLVPGYLLWHLGDMSHRKSCRVIIKAINHQGPVWRLGMGKLGAILPGGHPRRVDPPNRFLHA
jgi:hypothetical protein